MKKPIVPNDEYSDLVMRNNLICALQDVKRLSRRERYVLRHLKLHAAGGREGLAEKWCPPDEGAYPSIKCSVSLLDGYAYRNGCYLMLEVCRRCLRRAKRNLPEDNHHCDYEIIYEQETFIELLGEGSYGVRSCYSDDWESFRVRRVVEHRDIRYFPYTNESPIGYIHLVKHDEMTAAEEEAS